MRAPRPKVSRTRSHDSSEPLLVHLLAPLLIPLLVLLVLTGHFVEHGVTVATALVAGVGSSLIRNDPGEEACAKVPAFFSRVGEELPEHPPVLTGVSKPLSSKPAALS